MKKSQINENSDDDELETFNNSEDATKLSSSSLTKTKAKKSIFLYLKKQNINILKEIKKLVLKKNCLGVIIFRDLFI